jgi:hypothetical protein
VVEKKGGIRRSLDSSSVWNSGLLVRYLKFDRIQHPRGVVQERWPAELRAPFNLEKPGPI